MCTKRDVHKTCRAARHVWASWRPSPGWFDLGPDLRYDAIRKPPAGPRVIHILAAGRNWRNPMATVQNEAQQAFTAKMQAKHITPLWTIANRIVINEPTPKIPPVFWN